MGKRVCLGCGGSSFIFLSIPRLRSFSYHHRNTPIYGSLICISFSRPHIHPDGFSLFVFICFFFAGGVRLKDRTWSYWLAITQHRRLSGSFAFIFFFLHLETEPLGRLREWGAGNSGSFYLCFVFWWYPANLIRERREEEEGRKGYRRRWRERERQC